MTTDITLSENDLFQVQLSTLQKQANNQMNRIARKYQGYKHPKYYKARFTWLFYKSECRRHLCKNNKEPLVHSWINTQSKLKIWKRLREKHGLNKSLVPQANLEESLHCLMEQKVMSMLKSRQEVETRGDGNCLFYSLLGYTESNVTPERQIRVVRYRKKIAAFIRSYPFELLDKWGMLLSDIQDEKSKFSTSEWKEVEKVLAKCSGTGTLDGEELSWVQKRLCDLYSLILDRGNTFGANIVMLAFALMKGKRVVVVQEYNNIGLKLIASHPSQDILDPVAVPYDDVIVLKRVLLPRGDGSAVEHYRFFQPNHVEG